MTIKELETDISLIHQERKQLQDKLQEVEDKMLQVQTEDEADGVQHDILSLKKEIEEGNKNELKLQEYQNMIKSINQILPEIIALLGSRGIYDVTESIKLLFLCYKTNIQEAEIGIKRMLSLIWSKEKTIQEEVQKTYWVLYLDIPSFTPQQVAQNLI